MTARMKINNFCYVQEKDRQIKQKGPKFYMLWETDTEKERMRRIHDHVSAPKRDLPGRSFN